MRKKIPKIHESVEQLQILFKSEKDLQKKQRLQALYLLQSKQAKTRLDLASFFSLHRHTIAQWLNLYEDGGLPLLLTIYVPPGKPSSFTPEIKKALKTRLDDPSGFHSYGEIQQYLAEKHDLHLCYSRVHDIVHYEMKAKLKTARPSHKKKR
ncbi:MAG: helix-turn-helix domain-containing protein [Betaproteobacteria bacterium]|nr:MAG: helix-turn-helix domain-containing protein [Betaproteobacteria bacterium]